MGSFFKKKGLKPLPQSFSITFLRKFIFRQACLFWEVFYSKTNLSCWYQP